MSMLLIVKAMQTKVGNPLRKLVLIKLADNANDQGECWPSYQYIADQCEISKRSVISHINALCEAGLLTKIYRDGTLKGNSSNLYCLTIGSEFTAPPSANAAPPSANAAPPSESLAPPPSANAAPRISHSLESVKETVIKDMSVSTKHDGSVSEIFAYWQSAMNSPRSKLGADKKKKILTALKTYSIEEIKKAILGCAMTPFNMGDNDQQTKYNGLELILRNSEKIDKFISHADNPPAARKQKPVIDNNDTSWGKDFGDIY